MSHKKKLIMIFSGIALIGLGVWAFTLLKPGFLGWSSSGIAIGSLQESYSGKKMVTLFFPTGAIDNLDQTVLVSFAQPMVALTNLDKQADCPLTITPSVSGKCRWISTQTVEFTPQQRKPATKYVVIVSWATDIYTGMFSTPLLQRGISQKESLHDGMQLVFNFPVKDGQLQKYLVVTDTQSNQKVPIKITQDVLSWVYILQPQVGVRKYLTTYNFSLSSSLETQEGNLPSTLSGLSYTTLDALTDVMLQKVVKNQGEKWFENYRYNEWNQNTNPEVQWYGYQSLYDIYNTVAASASLLPIQNIAFDMMFQEPITDFSPKTLSLVKDGVAVPATLSYVPETIYNSFTNTEKIQTTKKKIRLLITGKLVPDANYQLQYTPDGKTVVASRSYKTSAPLKVTRIELLGYSKVCIYTNNPINTTDNLLTTTPNARIQSIGQEDYIPEELMNQFSKVTKNTIKNFLADNGFCPQPNADEIAYAINTRLNPSSTYTLKFTVNDIYGNTLPPITKKFATNKIQDKDKFLYIGYPDKNTVPSDVPLIVKVQSINTDTANIAVCTMDIEKYLANKNKSQSYDASGNLVPFTPNCTQSFAKDIPLKNNNRLLSTKGIDLEKDIGGKNITDPIVGVVWSFHTDDPIAKKRWFSTIFIRSNLSLMLEQGSNKNIVLATTFNGTPVKWLSFKWYRFENGTYVPVAITAKYDDTQRVYVVNNTADVIVASNPKYRGMLESTSDITENYDFGYIAGQWSAEKDFLYLYTERPIYKPGDTVYYKWILRTFNFNGFQASKKTTGNIIVSNELGEEVMKLAVKLDKNSNFNGSFTLPKDMSLGWYSLRFQTPDQQEIFTNAMFVVEEYHKPVFKTNIDSGTNDILAGETAKISLNPVYYFWGKVTNAQGNYQILSQKYFFNAKDYGDFQFGEGNDYINCIYWDECSYMDTPIAAQDSSFMINAAGNYTVNYATDTGAAEKLYSFIFQVQDPTTKRPVSTTVTKVIHATDGYVGLQVPYRNTKEQWIILHAVTLDWDAAIKANTPVTIKFIKQDWKAIKKQGIDGVFYYDYSLNQTIESTQTVTSDSKWMIEKTLQPKSDGEYLVSVSYQGKGSTPFVSSQTVYVSGKDPLLWRTENNSVTKVIAEKNMVNIGETANYTIQSPINTGTIFIAVEKDDGILKYITMPLQNYATNFSLKIEKDYYPNIYLRVFLIGQQTNNPLPIYKRGLAISKVNTLSQKLHVEITTNKQLYLPGDTPKITVKVTDANNAPVSWADLSIGIVDQSLLALKGNPIKNPFAYFYDMKRYLWTFTWLSLNTLVDKLEIKDTSDGSKGGDGASMKWWNSRKKRWIFKDTAYRNADVITDTKGEANISADALPDNLTTWVIESLVNTKDTKVGIATNTIQTALPLMISPNLPNIFSINDTVVLHPVIFNKTDKEQNVSLSISWTYLNITDTTKKITVPAQSQVAVDFTAIVTGANLLYTQKWASKVEMVATTSDANIRDEIQLYIPVVQNVTKETVTTVGNISGGKAIEQLDIPQNLQGYLSLTYSKSLFGSLLQWLSWSSESAYACLEQRFSSFMAHIYIKDLFLSVKKGDAYDFDKIFYSEWTDQFDGYKKVALPGYIKSQLASLEKYQNTDGGFMYRYDTTLPQKSSIWLTIYIVSALAALRDAGFTVADKIPTNAINYLKERFYASQKYCVQNKINCEWRAQQGIATISALMDFSPSDTSTLKMWELIKPYMKDNISLLSAVKQAIILGKLWQKKEASKVVNTLLNNQLVMEPKTAHIGKYTSYENILATAYFLEASSYIPEFMAKNTVIYDALQRWIAEQKKNGQWWSTQDTIAVIKSLTRFISANPISTQKMKVSTHIWSTTFADMILAKDDPFASKTVETYLAKIAHQSKITIQSDTKDLAYYDITMNYFVPAQDVQSRDEWFVIQKKYYNYESYINISRKKTAERYDYMQNKISYTALKYPKEITQYLEEEKNPKIGEVLVVNSMFVTSEPREQVAIDNYIPAGTELINPNLATESTYTNKLQNTNNQQNGYGYGYQWNMDQTQESASVNIQTFACDKEEFRTEKHFCYIQHLDPGVYTLMSLIRVTHAGKFAVRPTMIFEFYHPENFGRTFGQQFIVSQ